MKILAAAVLALAVTGCALLQQLEGRRLRRHVDHGHGVGGSTSTSQGSNCGTDPDTSAVLCLGSGVCPGLTIDSEVYPGCGFRVNGTAVDIECSCSGWLCPLGAASCSDAQATKLASASAGVICSELGNGICVQGTPVSSAAGSSSGGTCDTTCRTECAGEPTCIQACGC